MADKSNYALYPQALQVIKLLASGITVTSACEQVGISNRKYFSLINNDENLHIQHEEAFLMGIDALADILVNIHTHTEYNHLSDKEKSLLCRNIRFLIERLNPLRYGKRSHLTIQKEESREQYIISALASSKPIELAGPDSEQNSEMPGAEEQF